MLGRQCLLAVPWEGHAQGHLLLVLEGWVMLLRLAAGERVRRLQGYQARYEWAALTMRVLGNSQQVQSHRSNSHHSLSSRCESHGRA